MTMHVLALSGGLDSTVLLARIRRKEPTERVLAVSFTYGSKHNPLENAAAKAIADHYQVELREVDLTPIMQSFKSDLMKSGKPLPEGHYAEESMRRTVVPGRNIIFASLLSGIAWSEAPDDSDVCIYLGIHAGDHFIYPDCRPEFANAMADAISKGTGDKVQLYAPFLHKKKDFIVNLGVELKVPFEKTRTCYSEHATACGVCGSCQERLESFMLVGATDPLPYTSRRLLPSTRQ